MVGFLVCLTIGLFLTGIGLIWEESVLIFLGGFGIGLMLHFAMQPGVSAIDVYRGKTTLEITYRDGVAVDSVVVFKNK